MASISTDTNLAFPQASGNWRSYVRDQSSGTQNSETRATHWALMSAPTGNVILLTGSLATPREINNGDSTSFASGNLTLTLTVGGGDALKELGAQRVLSRFVGVNSYLALFTGPPVADDGISHNEMHFSNGYARVLVAPTAWGSVQ